MEVKIYQQAQSRDVYVEAAGRIVLDACETLKNTVLPHLSQKVDTMHVDLSSVDFIDSAGLGVLVGIKMTANKCKARLMLIAPSKNVYDILYVSKLENIFDIVTGPEAELLRTSMSTPEFLIQQASSKPEEPIPSRGGEAAPQRPGVSSAQSVGVEDKTVGARTGVTAATSGPATGDVKRPAPTAPSQAAPPIQEPLPAAAAAQPDQEAAGGENDPLNDMCKQALELMRQGLYEKAAKKYEEALAVDPNYLPALNNLAIVYEKKPAWYDKAREQWQRVLQVSESQGDQKHAKRAQKHLENLEKMA